MTAKQNNSVTGLCQRIKYTVYSDGNLSFLTKRVIFIFFV